jgi:hypothetical protein
MVSLWLRPKAALGDQCIPVLNLNLWHQSTLVPEIEIRN